ncbi:MAG TPA: methylaspartate mutase accessory protein GlmL [Syntrophorhabdaceae bacterium]|nr:methylaspartate mutase accessory protein GlmL [Syntrophorhabdaceae bacterium]
MSRRKEGDMSIHLLIDFGSTYTKVMAVDLEKEIIVGRAQAPTTVTTDITVGLNKAFSELVRTCNIDEKHITGKYASSSAAGGLKMAAIGLVPQLTVEAARRACLGAGAKVVRGFGFEIDETIVRDIEDAKCDIVLLCGGTDGGDKNVILQNSNMLAKSSIDCPILVAGNRVVSEAVKSKLANAGKRVYVTKNVMPSIDTLEVEPAQVLIREIFITHITKAKGLQKAQDFIGSPIIPTPKATLQAAALLADGMPEEPGIGSLVIVEVGGATTNIHSVGDSSPATPQTVVRGLPELRIKRTVEGDLGIRYNAQTIYDLMGYNVFVAKLRHAFPKMDVDQCNASEQITYLSHNVDHVPRTQLGLNIDIVLAESAASMAVQRHAGTLKQEFTLGGEVMVQNGKNLLDVKNLIGTGGIFKYGLNPERVLRSAIFSADTPWSLKPKSPNVFIDRAYMLYGIGLLAEHFPLQALRIAKKYLTPASPDKALSGQWEISGNRFVVQE